MLKSQLKQKTLTLSLVSVGNMLVLLAVFIWLLYSSVLDERKLVIQAHVDSTIDLLAASYASYEQEGISEQQAKQHVFYQISSVNYLNQGYIWLAELDGTLVHHPFGAELVGQSFWDVKDVTGKLFAREFVDVATNGGGFVDYYWPRPDTEIPVNKTGYVHYFEPWGLVVGSGLYTDDLVSDVFKHIAVGVFSVVILSVVSVIVSLRLSRGYLTDFRHDAIFDSLTGLYTRSYLVGVGKELVSAQTPHKRLAVLFLDVDFFKKVNDQYGHSMGDMVLRCMGKLIRKTMTSDQYAVRYGGEELLVLVYEDEQTAMILAERIREIVSGHQFRTSKGQGFNVTLSAGVALGRPEEALSDIITRADECLYQAKNTGRDKVVSESQLVE